MKKHAAVATAPVAIEPDRAAAPVDPTAAPTTAAPDGVVVFGLDDAGKAHASRFGAADAALAIKAAGLMGYQVCPSPPPTMPPRP